MLLTWGAALEAALGSEYPPAPMEPTVQGDVAEYTRPERYAYDKADYEQLDRAVRRVADLDPLLRAVLWQKYAAGGSDERLMAEEMGWSLRHWREWLEAARWAFLREYEGVDAGAVALDNRA
jgi:hypothetical protein